ncbi:hypothetical protein A2U01_0078516, partial [Trifolium medium]|nr:hypothetical protein [Trifolium medium]
MILVKILCCSALLPYGAQPRALLPCCGGLGLCHLRGAPARLRLAQALFT